MAKSFRKLIIEWPGGRPGFARDLGISYEGARAMSDRNSINASHWAEVLKQARRRRVPLTPEDLLRMSRARRQAARSGVAA